MVRVGCLVLIVWGLVNGLFSPCWAGTTESADAAYRKGDFTTAFNLLLPLAEQGNAAAQNDVGYLYDQGQGAALNPTEAAKWFRKAADQGNDSAQINLGNAYYYGKGVKRNYEEAVKWYQKAADRGNATAKENLGLSYECGGSSGHSRSDSDPWPDKCNDTLDDYFWMSITTNSTREQLNEKFLSVHQPAIRDGSPDAVGAELSVLRLVITRDDFTILYHQPRQTLVRDGVKPGAILFKGAMTGANTVAGKGTIYTKPCGSLEFDATGRIDRWHGTIELAESLPIIGTDCQVSGSTKATFRLFRRDAVVPMSLRHNKALSAIDQAIPKAHVAGFTGSRGGGGGSNGAPASLKSLAGNGESGSSENPGLALEEGEGNAGLPGLSLNGDAGKNQARANFFAAIKKFAYYIIVGVGLVVVGAYVAKKSRRPKAMAMCKICLEPYYAKQQYKDGLPIPSIKCPRCGLDNMRMQ